MPDKINWYSKPTELPSYFRFAVYKDIQMGVTVIVDSDGETIEPTTLTLDEGGYPIIGDEVLFSAPKSDIEIQSDVKAYRRGKKWGIIGDDLNKL